MVIEGNLMTPDSDQIGKIERLADRLKKWQQGEIPHAIKHYSRYVQLIRFVEPQANIVLMGLSAGMPETVRIVHARLQELLRKASQVDILKQEDADEARREDAVLLELSNDLVLMLEGITANAEPAASTLNRAEHVVDGAEQRIIEILRDKTLTGQKLAKAAGRPYDFKFKSSLSGLRKRGILGNKSPGYFLEPEYEFLLSGSD
jgi:hypothetical protein